MTKRIYPELTERVLTWNIKNPRPNRLRLGKISNNVFNELTTKIKQESHNVGRTPIENNTTNEDQINTKKCLLKHANNILNTFRKKRMADRILNMMDNRRKYNSRNKTVSNDHFDKADLRWRVCKIIVSRGSFRRFAWMVYWLSGHNPK